MVKNGYAILIVMQQRVSRRGLVRAHLCEIKLAIVIKEEYYQQTEQYKFRSGLKVDGLPSHPHRLRTVEGLILVIHQNIL